MRALRWCVFVLAAACAVDVSVPPGHACDPLHPCVSGHVCTGGVCIDASATGGGTGGGSMGGGSIGGGSIGGGSIGGGGGTGGGACLGCISQGQCRTGDTTSSCGTGGLQCTNCSSTASDCTGGMCLCHAAAACTGGQLCFSVGCSTCATACPGGCCSGNSCRTERVDRCSSAGLGSACVDCGLSGDGCDGGCLCGAGPACGPGKTCTDGTCYDAGFGPCGACDGCCPPDGGACVGKLFTSIAQCGRSGRLCTTCGTQMVCMQGSCDNP